MKKNNQIAAARVSKQVKSLRNFNTAILCGAVANLDEEVVIAIAKAAEKEEGNYEGLTVNNPKTKRNSLIGIIGEDLAAEAFSTPAAVGPIYNMVHHIQSSRFGTGASAKEERAARQAEGEALAGTGKRKGRVINNEFDLACAMLCFDSDNLSEWEEEEAMRYAGWIQ